MTAWPPWCRARASAAGGDFDHYLWLGGDYADFEAEFDYKLEAGRRKLLTFLTKPRVIRRILEHLGLPAEPPPTQPARPPPEAALHFA